jgi:hypothetical protein
MHRTRFALSALTAAFLLAACSADPTMGPSGSPDVHATHAAVLVGGTLCTTAMHDRFTTVGPDGKRYATWHPPYDALPGCSYGHEHGRDPRGSRLYASIGDVPFGYANAQLALWNSALTRNEDHVGHKLEWENDVPLQRTLNGRRVNIGVTCSFLTKLHQGTHSHDAFTNNLHELVYHVKCSDGTELHSTLVSQIGKPGEFVRSCDKRTVVRAGAPTPAASPAGGGVRFIPDVSCTDKYVLVPAGQWSQYSSGLYEDWITANYLRTPDGRTLAYYDPHFAVFSPSRYYDSANSPALARTIALCDILTADGRKARGGECDWSTNYGAIRGMTFDDTRSAFNGVSRETYFNQTTLTNRGGPTTWYTDPFGGSASTTPFAGAIKQFVASVNNTRPYPLESQAFGKTRRYGAAGTRAPN